VKWVAFTSDAAAGCGVVANDAVHPFPGPESLIDLIQLGGGALERAATESLDQAGLAIDAVKIRAPFDPPTMRDFMGFHEHIRNVEAPAEIDSRHSRYPTFYFANPVSVIGAFDDVPIAPGATQFDFELEIAAVIGRAGSNLRVDEADDHIAGYTTYLDWSARDIQRDEMDLRLGPAKGKDTATTLGPFFVTSDEFASRRNGNGFDVKMSASLNGEVITDNNWNTVSWSFADMVAYASRGTTVRPGDVLATGTVGGGCLLEHYVTGSSRFSRWLQPGDVLETHVDLVGDTRQIIVAAEERHPLSSGW
jgi:2-keto-4-pentenoate hydratase/2-oxohepta-3-ene-1,7-dioic acid hydratase in catechol pathway